jgi:hypothetical protein
VENSCEFRIGPSGSMNAGKLSSGLSSSDQLHIVIYLFVVYLNV